jgi:hypothetical protein
MVASVFVGKLWCQAHSLGRQEVLRVGIYRLLCQALGKTGHISSMRQEHLGFKVYYGFQDPFLVRTRQTVIERQSH